jgi:predicted PurR-regulated permease PerM
MTEPGPARVEATGRWTYPRRVALATAVVLLVVLLVLLVDVLLLLFGSVVLAAALRSLAHLLERRARVPERWSVPAAVLLVLVVAALIGWAVGETLAGQLSRLGEQLPKAWAATTAWLERFEFGRTLLALAREALANGELPTPRLTSVAGTALGALGSLVLMLIVAIYLAADPQSYRRGLVRLLPWSWHARAETALQASRDGLRRWLLGQGLAMLFIGTSTGLALWLLGVPLAPILGLITGLLAFVPFYGSIAGAVLPILIAFDVSPQTALWVALLYLAIQQVEEFALVPLIQRRAVALPPVLSLVAALIFGVLLGPFGVVLATPLMVVVMILARTLYIDGVLDARDGVRASSPSA